MKYNLRKVMLQIWKIYRKEKELSFAEVLHRTWLSVKAEEIIAKRIQEAKTWNGWKHLGYEVVHGSKVLSGANLI